MKPTELIAVLILTCNGELRAADGYEAIGYLTYTSSDSKRILMFDVKMAETWRIHTEPVDESKGGFDEGFSDTNNCVWCLRALASAPRPSESPFEKLRAELKQSKKDYVYFKSPLANFRPPSRFTVPQWDFQGVETNVAVATVWRGKYLPMDSSYASFFWFALSPPSPQVEGTNQMLLQIWDNGDFPNVKFRSARWKTFSEPPGLVASAVYTWPGKGEKMAARYEVNATTNLGGLLLPTKITLTRFSSKAADSGEVRVLTTDVAVIVSVKRLPPGPVVTPEMPGRTCVSDYRFENGGRPAFYFVNGGPLTEMQIEGPFGSKWPGLR